MIYTSRSIELQTLASNIHKWQDAWREKEKEYKECELGNERVALGVLAQASFNKYDDLVKKLRLLVGETLEAGMAITVIGNEKKRVISGKPQDIILCWWNGQLMRWVDKENYWRSLNWAAVTEVSVTDRHEGEEAEAIGDEAVS